MFRVEVHNLRTGEITCGSLFKSAEVAEDNARRGAKMARDHKMLHLVYRTVWVEG